MPRYEYSSGTSNKFWEISLNGTEYNVRYGRIGTAGSTSTKSFADEATAKKKYEAAIKSKTRKGYVEVAGDDGEDETDARMVLADQLMESGDPRGQLIPIQAKMLETSGDARSALRKQMNKLLSEHADALLGPLQTDENKSCSTVEWKLGFWDRVKVGSNYDHEGVVIADLLGHMLRHPSGAQIDHLHLAIPESVWDGESDWQPMLNVLAEVGAPELRSLECADYEDNAEISWCEIGNFAEVWGKVPKLERLKIRGVGVSFGTIDAPNLKTLEIVSGGLPSEPVEQLGKATLPNLQKLEVYFGTDDYGADSTVDTCAGILAGKGLPNVTWLGLKNGEIMDELAVAVVKAPIVKQLKHLDLSMGTMTDDGANALIKGAAALKHLERLDVSQNFLSSAVCSALQKALPQAVTYGQKDAHEYGDDEPWYYTTVAE